MLELNRLYARIRKIFFLAAILLSASFAFSPAAHALYVGDRVPGFTLTDMRGEKVSLEDFRGQKIILNFWATWCPPCRQEMPEFNEMDAELKKSGEAVLLAINLTDGQRETKTKVAQYLKSNKLGMRVLLDTEGKVSGIFSIRGIPTTVIIDGNGVLREQIVGATTKDNVLQILRKY